MLEKRSKVIEELLQTEKDYIKDLQMCVEEIIEPLQKKQVRRCRRGENMSSSSKPNQETFIRVFLTFFLHLLKVKNVDFDGLFGNIGSVIDLSQRLYETLQDTDSIGKKPVSQRCTSFGHLFHQPGVK